MKRLFLSLAVLLSASLAHAQGHYSPVWQTPVYRYPAYQPYFFETQRIGRSTYFYDSDGGFGNYQRVGNRGYGFYSGPSYNRGFYLGW